MAQVEKESLVRRFRRFADESSLFARGIIGSYSEQQQDRLALVEANLNVAKTLFGKWSIEILAILYNADSAGFQELRRMLGHITSRVLSQKLRMMEHQGLVQRTVIDARPIAVRYALTEKGLTVARLGEPVFLYLRLSEGPI